MIAFPSCALIEINGLGNDYNDLTESQKALVRPLESFEDARPGWVYKLTMPMLKEELVGQFYFFEDGRLTKVVDASDGTLKISTRLLDGNEVFNIGDRIISVNGETINEDNICYYYDLLATQNDWSEFEIETR